MKKVKLNPIVHDLDILRDEKLDLFFTHDEWVEVSETEWKRLSQATRRVGNMKVATLIADGEGWGDVASVEKPKAEEPKADWWEDDAVEQEEE